MYKDPWKAELTLSTPYAQGQVGAALGQFFGEFVFRFGAQRNFPNLALLR